MFSETGKGGADCFSVYPDTWRQLPLYLPLLADPTRLPPSTCKIIRPCTNYGVLENPQAHRIAQLSSTLSCLHALSPQVAPTSLLYGHWVSGEFPEESRNGPRQLFPVEKKWLWSIVSGSEMEQNEAIKAMLACRMARRVFLGRVPFVGNKGLDSEIATLPCRSSFGRMHIMSYRFADATEPSESSAVFQKTPNVALSDCTSTGAIQHWATEEWSRISRLVIRRPSLSRLNSHRIVVDTPADLCVPKLPFMADCSLSRRDS
ncbi:unnamed protein product [Caenorhabditis auriculariae]|uniref:Uncharacterized protein n=1 Tax=Caenorhabditis auriculariae TaxID=2777116 RepID=A0A8S1HS35_9PELO|nr:unnamed protein product [Caenorhabditis auriculariae]